MDEKQRQRNLARTFGLFSQMIYPSGNEPEEIYHIEKGELLALCDSVLKAAEGLGDHPTNLPLIQAASIAAKIVEDISASGERH